jgi:regulator of replication initiation timing
MSILDNYYWEWKSIRDKITELEEENRSLKSELSKFRDSFKKYRDYEKEELAESCYDLARENEKLKEEISGLRDTQYTHWEPTVSSWWVWGHIYIL